MEGQNRKLPTTRKQPEVVDLVEEVDVDFTILFGKENDDVEFLTEVIQIGGSDDEWEDDGVLVEAVLGVREKRGGGAKVDNEVEEVNDEEQREDRGITRPYAKVVAGTPLTNSKDAQSEKDVVNEKYWPPLQPYEVPCPSSSSNLGQDTPFVPPENQMVVEEEVESTVDRSTDLVENQADEVNLRETAEVSKSAEVPKAAEVPEAAEVPMAAEVLKAAEVLEVITEDPKGAESLEEKEASRENVPNVNAPHWDTPEDVAAFCAAFNAAFDGLEAELEAKKQAKLKAKEDKKKARQAARDLARDASREENPPKRAGLRDRPNVTVNYSDKKKVAPKAKPSPGPSTSATTISPPVDRKERKRKISDDTEGTLGDFVSPPPLTRPSSSRTRTVPEKIPEEEDPRLPEDPDVGWVDGDAWEIEGILDSRVEKNSEGKERITYKVKWKGWDDTHNSWVKQDDVSSAALKTFWRRILKRIKEQNGPFRRAPVQPGKPEPKSSSYFMG